MERKQKIKDNKPSANLSAKQCTVVCIASKCTLRCLLKLFAMPDIKTNRKHESEIDDSHSLRSFQASKHTFFKHLHSLIILPAALEVLIYRESSIKPALFRGGKLISPPSPPSLLSPPLPLP